MIETFETALTHFKHSERPVQAVYALLAVAVGLIVLNPVTVTRKAVWVVVTLGERLAMIVVEFAGVVS